MIRQTLSNAFTQIANALLPHGYGDEWKSENFVVIFRRLLFDNPAPSDDDEFETICSINGDVIVRIFENEFLTPIDPTQLMIFLREEPIFIPLDKSIEIGEFTIQMLFKPDELSDETFRSTIVEQTIIVPQIRGTLTAYVFKRQPALVLPDEFKTVTMVFSDEQEKTSGRQMVVIDVLAKSTDGVFSIQKNYLCENYCVKFSELEILANDAPTFNMSPIKVFLNGSLLEKNVDVVFFERNKIQLLGTVFNGDVILLTN